MSVRLSLMCHCSVFRNCLHFGYVASQLGWPDLMSRARRPGPLRTELGVLWPRAVHKRRHPGRPSYQETWEDRLYRAIQHGTVPEDMSSGVMPKWWRPSLPLNVSKAETERIAGKLVDAVQHAPEKEEPSESP